MWLEHLLSGETDQKRREIDAEGFAPLFYNITGPTAGIIAKGRDFLRESRSSAGSDFSKSYAFA